MSRSRRSAPRQDASAFLRRAFLQLLFVLFAVFPAKSALAAPSTDVRPDVVVVGEGPVGLSVAIQIKKSDPNAHVLLVEKRGLDRAGRVNTPTLLSGTLNYLDELGVHTGPENPSFTYFTARSRDRSEALDVSHLINGSAVATAPIGVIEAELRAVALKSGVEVRYETEVLDTVEHSQGVQLKLKDGSHIDARFAVLAGGKGSVGWSSASRGGIPMVAGVSKVAGNGELSVYDVDAQGRRLPAGHAGEGLTVTRIGARQGTALLLQVRDGMPDAARTELYARVVDAAGLPKESFERTSAFTSELTVGSTGTKRVFSIGDHGMTVPTLTGAGVNRGFAEARDLGRVLGKIVAEGGGATLSPRESAAIDGFHTSWKSGREAFATHVAQTYASKMGPAPPPSSGVATKSEPVAKRVDPTPATPLSGISARAFAPSATVHAPPPTPLTGGRLSAPSRGAAVSRSAMNEIEPPAALRGAPRMHP